VRIGHELVRLGLDVEDEPGAPRQRPGCDRGGQPEGRVGEDGAGVRREGTGEQVLGLHRPLGGLAVPAGPGPTLAQDEGSGVVHREDGEESVVVRAGCQGAQDAEVPGWMLVG
jgi:hypothetical protein